MLSSVLSRKLLSVLLFSIKVGIFAVFVSAPFASGRRENPVYSNEFAVNVPGGDTTADLLAAKHGFINKGQVRFFFFSIVFKFDSADKNRLR